MKKIIGTITLLIFIMVGCAPAESKNIKNQIESAFVNAGVSHEDASESDEKDITEEAEEAEEAEEEDKTEAETELEEEQAEEQLDELEEAQIDGQQEELEESIEKTEEIPAGETSQEAVDAVSSASKTQNNSKQNVPSPSTSGDTTTEQTAESSGAVDAVSSASKIQNNFKQSVPSPSTPGETTTGQTVESSGAVDAVSSASKTQNNSKRSVPSPSTAGDSTTGQTAESSETVVWTLELLTQYNGKNGQPAYIAVDGIIYDVTGLSPWSNGTHQGYSAGQDLTDVFKSVHGTSMLKGLTVVGVLGESLDASMIANKQTSSIMDSVGFDENDDEDDDKDEDKDNDDDNDDNDDD